MLPFATKWMQLENIMLSEVSQSEKDKNLTISLICVIYEKKKKHRRKKVKETEIKKQSLN